MVSHRVGLAERMSSSEVSIFRTGSRSVDVKEGQGAGVAFTSLLYSDQIAHHFVRADHGSGGEGLFGIAGIEPIGDEAVLILIDEEEHLIGTGLAALVGDLGKGFVEPRTCW